jgi:hypothetical protein
MATTDAGYGWRGTGEEHTARAGHEDHAHVHGPFRRASTRADLVGRRLGRRGLRAAAG